MNRFLALLVSLVVAEAYSLSQSYSEIQKLLDGRNSSKAESILKSKISANMNDDSARFFKGQIPVRMREEKRYDEAIINLKKCVEYKNCQL
ncbi:MAG: hypothetical protein AAB344_06245 [Bacteroidota bacterium]